ncbi:unnamed protein product [Paramecium primaurelia]|uniref:Uncharacterized protein n=1 Tax=Paramecium primaurelia TaxID=5886 RepID=A0A8S1LHP0_PARPR|nr:unnamed protein product [Paramecium primaurelia]
MIFYINQRNNIEKQMSFNFQVYKNYINIFRQKNRNTKLIYFPRKKEELVNSFSYSSNKIYHLTKKFQKVNYLKLQIKLKKKMVYSNISIKIIDLYIIKQMIF